MKTKLISSKAVDASIFFSKINEALGPNLTTDTMISLSNILALDHATRLKSQPPVNIHIEVCIQRLGKYLNHKIITDESFAASLTLFGVAITPEKTASGDNQLEKQNKETALDPVMEIHFSTLSLEEKAVIKSVLENLLAGKDAAWIINFLNSDPELFYSIVAAAIREKKHIEDISESVRIHVNRLISKSKSLNKKVSFVKNLSGKFSLGAGLAAVSSAAAALGSMVFPAFLVPAAAASLKYTPAIGEKIGEIIADNMDSIQNQKNSIDRIKNTLAELAGKNNAVAQIIAQGKGTGINKSTEQLQEQKTTASQPSAQKKDYGKIIKEQTMQTEKQSKDQTKKSFLSR